MMKENKVFTPDDLPQFVEGTTGHAIPTPERRIACPVPPGVVGILAPWELQKVGPNHWHVVVETNMPGDNEERVTFRPDWVPVGMPRHDEYGNDEVFDTYLPLRILAYGDDPRADLLYQTYRHIEGGIKVFEVEKAVPVVVLGQVAEDLVFQTAESKEGAGASLQAGSYILRSALAERYYFNNQKKFGRLYGGNVLPGPVPLEAIRQANEAWAAYGFKQS